MDCSLDAGSTPATSTNLQQESTRMTEEKHVSLENLGEGAAKELFDLELSKVLDNIQDENTKANTIRTVTLTLKIKPEDDRSFGQVQIAAISKLAPVNPHPTMFYFGRTSKGRAVATEHNPRQAGLFQEPVPAENVLQMPGKEAKGD